jgi:hypothetical protein
VSINTTLPAADLVARGFALLAFKSVMSLWRGCFGLPHYKGGLRRLIILSRKGTLQKVIFPVFLFEHFQSLEFWQYWRQRALPLARELTNASVDLELPELQENIPAQ